MPSIPKTAEKKAEMSIVSNTKSYICCREVHCHSVRCQERKISIRQVVVGNDGKLRDAPVGVISFNKKKDNAEKDENYNFDH